MTSNIIGEAYLLPAIYRHSDEYVMDHVIFKIKSSH